MLGAGGKRQQRPEVGPLQLPIRVDCWERPAELEQAWIEEGEVRGEVRGAAHGRLMLLNQLEAKFGTLPVGVAARVEALTLAQLNALGVALIRAESLEELGLG